MTTMQALTPLLDRLFAEADAAEAIFRRDHATLDAAARDRLRSDWRAFYAETARDVPLAVSRPTGKLLYLLARATRARAIVEFGTSFAISTLHLAAALRDNGGGRLVTTELVPEKIARARAHLAEGRVEDLVELREGDALTSLAHDLPPEIDLVLLDGAKPLYASVLALLAPRLRPGAIVVADNADFAPDYLAIVRSSGWCSLPYGDDVEVSART